MSARRIRNLAAFALAGVLGLGCGGGGGGSGSDTLHIVKAGIADAKIVIDGSGANFSVDLDNQTGKEQWSVVLEIRLVQGTKDQRWYWDNVTWCGDSEGRVLPGPCNQSAALYPVLSSEGFDKTKPATARFGLYSLSTDTYYDQVDQTITFE